MIEALFYGLGALFFFVMIDGATDNALTKGIVVLFLIGVVIAIGIGAVHLTPDFLGFLEMMKNENRVAYYLIIGMLVMSPIYIIGGKLYRASPWRG
jgi:hypothetical protein